MSSGKIKFEEMAQRIGPAIGLTALIVLLAVGGLSRLGCANHHVTPGHFGYVKSKPLTQSAEFLEVIRGPGSTGWVWRQAVTEVDVRPKTYTSTMEVRDRQENPVAFDAHAVVGIDVSGNAESIERNLRRVVEEFNADDWYNSNVRREFELAFRVEVQKREAFEIKDEVEAISVSVKKKMDAAFADKPFYFESVNIGNIQYRDKIVQAVIKKKRRDYEVKKLQVTEQIEIAKRAVKQAEADGVADANRQIAATLSPMFVQWEALDAMKGLINSENTSFVIAPLSPDGMSPVIMNITGKKGENQ